MAAAKLASKQNRRRTALRVLGLAGVSLSLAGGASASTSGSATHIPAQKVTPPHEIIRGNLRREFVDVLRLRQGKRCEAPARRTTCSAGLRRLQMWRRL